MNIKSRKIRAWMIIRGVLLLAMSAAAAFSSPAVAAPAEPVASATIRGDCNLAFLVTSTLHDVPGSARCLPFAAVLARDAAGRQIIPSVEVDVPVAGMDTRNKTRDRQMREMFQSERFPRIHSAARDVDVERIRVETGKGRDGDASIELLLKIRDVERKVRATVSNLKESGDQVTFDLEFPVSLGEFDLKAPSVLGIIRVGDKVSVKSTFTLTVSRNP
jgi:polyisoprenoid-binding protein YceI